jgi:tRNA (guanine37-N1)-methyltransferase
MLIDVVTIFPDMFRAVLGQSILKRAQERRIAEIRLTDLREFAVDRHRSVDDRPFGGGPGMILKVEPVVKAVRALEADGPDATRILFSPQGERFTQDVASELSKRPRLLFVAGHYEGYDERIRTILAPREISTGDYVLTGGELPCMIVIDAVVRLLPGALGAEDAHECESFGEGPSHTPGARLLEHPHYTRPVEFEGHVVPAVLRSGDHERVAQWRRAQALKRTRARRPDLLEGRPRE